MTTDAERMQRYAERTRVPNPAVNLDSLTPLGVAQMYREGRTLSDEQIRQLRAKGNVACFAGVDPDERERLLAPPKQPEQKVVINASQRDSQAIGAILERLQATLAAPVVPEFAPDGKLIGARRVLPDPPPAPEPVVMAEPAPHPQQRAQRGTKRLVASIFKAMSEWIEPAFKGTGERLNALEDRIEALEQKPHMRYRAVWMSATQYDLGDIVTHDGSMWHANESTADRPGTSKAWTLAVKRGKDGR